MAKTRKHYCLSCKSWFPKDSFYLTQAGKPYPNCKSCHKNNPAQDERLKDPRVRMLTSSCQNSKKKGIEHTIKVKDITLPETCKYLGITIDYRRASERGALRSQDAPSIDRINPAIGYVPGNIQVISDLANRMKQDATIEQLIEFAKGVLRVHGD